MAPLVALTLLFLVASAGNVGADDPAEALPGVEDLTPDTFEKFVNGRKHALVEFYAPWCGHCKRMTPEFKKLGETVAADPKLKTRVVIAKVNADTHKDLAKRFGVTGFPTIKFFPRGKPVDSPESYNSGRTADVFLDFIKDKVSQDRGFARVDELDPIAGKILKSESMDTVYKELEEKVGSLKDDDKDNGELYLKVVKKAIEKGGSEYFQNEYDRLNKMLDSGNVNQQKAEEMTRKISVLSAFLPQEPEKEDESEEE